MRRPSAAMLVACAALACSISGTAVASGLITSAQIKDHTIATRDISAAAITALHGRRGPRGVAGARGATGVAGASLDATRLVKVNGLLEPITAGAGVVQYAAPCPSDSVLISGGYTVSGTVRILSSVATTFQQSWQVSADNPGTTSGSVQVQSVCLTQ